MTWMVYNPETRELLNLSSNIAREGTWWPILIFDLCILAADINGFHGPSQLSDFIGSPQFGTLGLFDWAFQGDTPCTKPTPIYVCPGGGRDRNQIAKCGGVDSFHCTTWGCETTGTVHWLTNPIKDLIQVNSPPDFPPCRALLSKPGQCFPLQIKFTDEGKKFTEWDVGRAWGLCLYQAGFDNGFQFELKLQLRPLYSAPKVALGPNLVIASKPSSQMTTPKPPSQNQSQDTRLVPHTPPIVPSIVDMPPPTDPLIKMISSAYLTLNASYPDLTNGCWLCYNIRPPYYEAVAFSSGFNVTADVSACRWQQQPGTGHLTVSSITGIGTCIGAIPETYQHLCNHTVSMTDFTNSTHQWIVPPKIGWWACSAGLTLCAHQATLKTFQDFCVLVHLILRLSYYSEEELQPRLETPGQYRIKREPSLP